MPFGSIFNLIWFTSTIFSLFLRWNLSRIKFPDISEKPRFSGLTSPPSVHLEIKCLFLLSLNMNKTLDTPTIREKSPKTVFSHSQQYFWNHSFKKWSDMTSPSNALCFKEWLSKFHKIFRTKRTIFLPLPIHPAPDSAASRSSIFNVAFFGTMTQLRVTPLTQRHLFWLEEFLFSSEALNFWMPLS